MYLSIILKKKDLFNNFTKLFNLLNHIFGKNIKIIILDFMGLRKNPTVFKDRTGFYVVSLPPVLFTHEHNSVGDYYLFYIYFCAYVHLRFMHVGLVSVFSYLGCPSRTINW